MKWMVYKYNINTKKFEHWNIFEHSRFNEEIQMIMLESGNTYEDFTEKICKSLFYYFWGKSEYELILKSWIATGEETKVDIYHQVMLNFEAFINYLWSKRYNNQTNMIWTECKPGQMPEDFMTDSNRKIINVLVTTATGIVTKVQRRTFDEGRSWFWERIYGEPKAWMFLPRKYEEIK